MIKVIRLKLFCCCAALFALLAAGCEEQISEFSAAESIKNPEEISDGAQEIEEESHNEIVAVIRDTYNTLRKKDAAIAEKEKKVVEGEKALKTAQEEYESKAAEHRAAYVVYEKAYYEYGYQPPKATYEELLDAYNKFDDAEKARQDAEKNRNSKQKNLVDAKADLKKAQDAAWDYAVFHARLVNLLMVMDEADSGKHECPYHLNAFHESVCVHVFEPDFAKGDKEAQSESGNGEDISISESHKPDPKRDDEESGGVDAYVNFQKSVYNNSDHLFITFTLPAFDDAGNPQYKETVDADGNLIPEDKRVRIYIDKEYSLEDDNQLNYLKFMDMTPEKYLEYFDYNGGKAKNVEGKPSLSEDARETAGYLPPLLFTGISENFAEPVLIAEFYSNKMWIDRQTLFDRDISSKKITALMDIFDSFTVPDVIPQRASIGYMGNILCREHLYSYHVITQPLIDYVNLTNKDNFYFFVDKYNDEDINILNFVEYFKIPKEKFIELTVDPGPDPAVNPKASSEQYLGQISFKSDIAPYHVEMLYSKNKAEAINYFRMDR